MMMATLTTTEVDRDELDRLRWAHDVLHRLVAADMEGREGPAIARLMDEAREATAAQPLPEVKDADS